MERELCSRTFIVFCGLHILANLSSKTLKEFDNTKDLKGNGAGGESGLVLNAYELGFVRLVRTASKAFTRGSDE